MMPTGRSAAVRIALLRPLRTRETLTRCMCDAMRRATLTEAGALPGMEQGSARTSGMMGAAAGELWEGGGAHAGMMRGGEGGGGGGFRPARVEGGESSSIVHLPPGSALLSLRSPPCAVGARFLCAPLALLLCVCSSCAPALSSSLLFPLSSLSLLFALLRSPLLLSACASPRVLFSLPSLLPALFFLFLLRRAHAPSCACMLVHRAVLPCALSCYGAPTQSPVLT